MIELSKHIQEGARLELEALELSTDECSFLSAQNSAQAMQIDALKADLAAAQEALKAIERKYECGLFAFKELDSLLAQVVNAQVEVAEANERAQRAEADAQRYRWLRDHGELDLFWSLSGPENKADNIDADIDAAMKEG